MKLKQIKLAGFKSFVDPTVLDLISDLVSIVGPNGCGKSNIIDAVRWVMGESSAKTLRGESGIDVIFNGSNTRKPVGQASVELIFDNSDGGIGGEYAAYAEISVRREVTRDGTSTYYLNGTRCRKRDISDVFLGTGLGPRSYSIIGQNTVSSFIESDPDALRKHLEEAAGIAVYKKRKHDTELRMHHTTENLARLEDLREEQIKLLERLQRQAESAQKYESFTKDKNVLEAELLAMRWKNYDTSLTQYSEQINTLSVTLEEKQAMRTNIGTQLEQLRIAHTDKADRHEEIQSKYYELGAVIARIEQTLQHHKERKQQITSDIEQIKASIVEITAQKTSDSDAFFACEEQMIDIKPNYETASGRAEAAEEIYLEARSNLEDANLAWEEYQQQAQKPQQEAEVQRARIEQLDKQANELQHRVERLQQEKGTLDVDGMEVAVAQLQEQMLQLEEQSQNYKTTVSELQQQIGQQRNALLQEQDEHNKVCKLLQQLSGRESSLQALQQAAMGKDDKAKQAWLEKHNLLDKLRIAEQLTVTAGWEVAVETVLADYLEAICIDSSFNDVVAAVNELTDGNVILFENHKNTSNLATSAQKLSSKVTTNIAINELLDSILIAETLADALALRNSLDGLQSIITKDGIWLGKNWLRISREKDNRKGVLAREQELQKIRADIEAQQLLSEELDEKIKQSNNNLHELEVELNSNTQIATEISAKLRDISAKHSAANQKLEHTRNRRARIDIELSEHLHNLQLSGEDANLSRTTLEIAIEAMAEFAKRKEEITARREDCLARERATKIAAKEAQEEFHNLEVEWQTVTTKLQGLKHTISRVDQQLADLHKRYAHLQQNLEDDIAPEEKLQLELENILSERVVVEEDLTQARMELDIFTSKMQKFEKERTELENMSSEIKEVLDKCRLERQGLEVRKETIDEQLQTGSIDLQQVLASMPEHANETEWSEKIDTLTRKINNLGAVNLAAAEELKAETQRQEYLETQYADLKEALTTLENAIKKIDKETKVKFQEIFTQINANFSALFPKLFGGGRACIELVGDDLLEAGVAVMAQPPGKKNASIHLLSGGEKALTAVALVFSIFQINPAPFCMLDEVDAPLDETNVVRFGNLIKEMSQQVQFIVISHNKTTMSIANQLVGVTMKEPGVSRLVTVDINEAVHMVTE